MQLGVFSYDFAVSRFSHATSFMHDKKFSGKYISSNFNTNVLQKPGFQVKNCFFKEIVLLIFLSRMKFSRATVSHLVDMLITKLS